jgi:putative oxidoreductase
MAYMERSIMILSDSTCKVWTPRILGILRIIIGFLFLQHGTAKLFGTPHIAMFDGLQLVSLLGLAGILELVGELLILVGLFTRQTAFILAEHGIGCISCDQSILPTFPTRISA